MFYVAMLNRLLELLDLLKIAGPARGRRRAPRPAGRGARGARWDGAWYIRAFGEGGRKIGSKENAAGRIFINTQSWAVIAGLPDRARLVRAMDSLPSTSTRRTGRRSAPRRSARSTPAIGLITRCVWGKKENGAVFCHPAAWLIQAECLLGRGGAGLRLLSEAPAGPGRSGDVPRRALRLFPVHHERRARDRGPGQPFLADRDGRLDVPRRLRPHPRHPAVLRGARRRSGHPADVERLPGRARLPRRALPHRGREPGRRRTGRRVDRPSTAARPRGRSRRGPPVPSAGSPSRWAKPHEQARGRSHAPSSRESDPDQGRHARHPSSADRCDVGLQSRRRQGGGGSSPHAPGPSPVARDLHGHGRKRRRRPFRRPPRDRGAQGDRDGPGKDLSRL